MLASRLSQLAAGSASAHPDRSLLEAPDASRPDPHAVPTSTEIVTRPDGLRRGVWEGSPWLFYVVAALVVLALALWGARRLGWLGGKRSS